MKKSTRKLIHILGTIFLLLGTVMSTITSVVSASTVSSVQVSRMASRSSRTQSVMNESSQAKSSVEVNSSSEKNTNSKMMSSSMKDVEKSSARNSVSAESSSNANNQNLAAAASSTSSNSGKIGETTITTQTQAQTNAFYPHFKTADGEVVYCYNWQLDTPDQLAGTKYNIYDFYNGLQSVTGNQTKVAKVAAALEAGYHQDATTGQYNVAPQFQNIAEQSYQAMQNSTDPMIVQNRHGETLAEFEQDVTQSVIWTLDGAPTDQVQGGGSMGLPDGYLATHTALGKALLQYAQSHPLDKETAYPQNVSVADDTGTIGNSHPLVMNPQTKLSQPFQLKNYNGGVDITGLPKGYEIVDNNGNVVNQVQSGQTYRVKYTGSGNPSDSTANDTVNKITAKANYESLKDSKYFSAQMKPDMDANNPYQNMVNLTTQENSFDFPIVWSSIASSSSAKSSSAVKSSSVKSLSSSVKSSSAVSSSKASSKSAKATSSKKATVTSSSNTAKKSAVTSSSVVSTKNSTKEASSSETAKATTSSSNNTTSAKKAVVTGVNHGSNSGKGTGHGQGKGEGHGMPQTGEAVATSLIAAGVVLLAAAGAITLRKRN